MYALLGVIVAFKITSIVGHPNGAPVTACDTMYPLHKHDPQTTPCPFESRPHQTEIISDSGVKITLHASSLTQALTSGGGHSSGSSSSEEKKHPNTLDAFKGYMIMAFDKSGGNNTAIGTFEVPSGSHTIDCHGMLRNAATHSTRSPKSIVELTWIPPAGFQGDVVFKTTYVASKKLFWIEQFSIPVHVKPSASIKENVVSSLESDDFDLPLIEEIDFVNSSQYIGLWAICSLVIVGFSCAVVAKLLFASRSKKYATVETI